LPHLTKVKADRALSGKIDWQSSANEAREAGAVSRRAGAIILAIVVALTAAGFAALGATRPQVFALTKHAAQKPERLMLVYVGADDCAPCRTWQRDQAPMLRSPAFARLIYREVKSPSVLALLADEHWPGDLREMRAQLRADAGVPLWFVVADDAVVGRAQGASEWEATILPKLRGLLR
jgi:hypothetical protein